ncbi:MAG: hypothetical protein ABW153_01340, partial [Sedimenticola sp.]
MGTFRANEKYLVTVSWKQRRRKHLFRSRNFLPGVQYCKQEIRPPGSQPDISHKKAADNSGFFDGIRLIPLHEIILVRIQQRDVVHLGRVLLHIATA